MKNKIKTTVGGILLFIGFIGIINIPTGENMSYSVGYSIASILSFIGGIWMVISTDKGEKNGIDI